MRLTLRIDDQLLRRVRLYAERTGTTVNDIVREYITKLATGEIEPYPTPPKRPKRSPSDDAKGSNSKRS